MVGRGAIPNDLTFAREKSQFRLLRLTLDIRVSLSDSEQACYVLLFYLVASLFSFLDLRQERLMETRQRSMKEPLRLHQLRLRLHHHGEPRFQLLVRGSR